MYGYLIQELLVTLVLICFSPVCYLWPNIDNPRDGGFRGISSWSPGDRDLDRTQWWEHNGHGNMWQRRNLYHYRQETVRWEVTQYSTPANPPGPRVLLPHPLYSPTPIRLCLLSLQNIPKQHHHLGAKHSIHRPIRDSSYSNPNDSYSGCLCNSLKAICKELWHRHWGQTMS